MATPPLLARDPVPQGNRSHHDPVVTVTAAALIVLIVGLFVLAASVVASYGITDPSKPSPAETISTGFVAPFAMILAIVFFATIALNVLTLAFRHFRRGARG